MEELTISYINGVNRTRSQRQKELDRWGFTYTYPACEETSEWLQKDKRAQMVALDQSLALILRRHGIPWADVLQKTQTLAAIQISEGLLNREIGLS